MAGLFDLKTAADLREKLRRDLEKLKASPLDRDAAFNFFVTAEHMLDWVYPKNANRRRRTEARKASVVLRVCSHMANGAKHFEVEGEQHDSVSSTGVGRLGVTAIYFSVLGPMGMGQPTRLYVTLRGDAAAQLGETIGVVELAEKAMAYWDGHPLA